MQLPRPDDPRWEKWTTSPWYYRIIALKRHGLAGLKGLGPREIRAVRRMAGRYKLANQIPGLLYVERNGELAKCITESDVPRYLRYAHEDHGHFATDLTLSRLVGQAYWPTRARDVYLWAKSCDPCQRLAQHLKLRTPRAIQEFRPMKMICIDWVGPINPPCSITGHQYILVAVDYFSKFVWAKSYASHTQEETMDFFIVFLVPVFGWPEWVYSDNGGHFAGTKLPLSLNTITSSKNSGQSAIRRRPDWVKGRSKW